MGAGSLCVFCVPRSSSRRRARPRARARCRCPSRQLLSRSCSTSASSTPSAHSATAAPSRSRPRSRTHSVVNASANDTHTRPPDIAVSPLLAWSRSRSFRIRRLVDFYSTVVSRAHLRHPRRRRRCVSHHHCVARDRSCRRRFFSFLRRAPMVYTLGDDDVRGIFCAVENETCLSSRLGTFLVPCWHHPGASHSRLNSSRHGPSRTLMISAPPKGQAPYIRWHPLSWRQKV